MTDPEIPFHQLNAAAAAAQARDELLRVAAQELEGSTAAVLLQIEDALTLVGPERSDLGRKLERIGHLVQRLTLRTAALLNAPRLDTDSFRPDTRPLDLAELVRDVAEAHMPQARHAGLGVRVTAPGALPAMSDRVTVGQIVYNLLSTAVTRSAGAPVDMTLVRSGDAARLSVSGADIAPEEQALLYEPFERAIAAGGDLIGLWVARRLAETLGGSLLVAAGGTGAGAALVFTLPLNPARTDPPQSGRPPAVHQLQRRPR